jgi:MoaA/NifB/PqqE/SkfB family radical SAM enzyme
MADSSFPRFLSLTITNQCNLRCRMCAQWSESGYMLSRATPSRDSMTLDDWKRVVDEAHSHGIQLVLIRGGEPFMHPQIIDLLDHIAAHGMFTAIDSNGTRMGKFAEELVRIGRLHVTISVDGPEAIHDQVRGRSGCFAEIAAGVAAVHAAEQRAGRTISMGITFTISPWSYRGLSAMPSVARSLGIETLCIVPFFHLPESVGRDYEQELRDAFTCEAYSWRGACHETSGVDIGVLKEQLHAYQAQLGTLTNYPYLPLAAHEYQSWFESPTAQVGSSECLSVERVLDIQPNGDVNFCVDYPDFTFGNVRRSSIAELWNGELAQRFRERRRQAPFGACHRCVAKYMAVDRAP